MRRCSILFVVLATACEDNSLYCNEDVEQNLLAVDGDCDGFLTADDCDDADNTSTVGSEDGGCDRVLTVDDCNDSDATNTLTFADPDCDFAPTGYAYITQN